MIFGLRRALFVWLFTVRLVHTFIWDVEGSLKTERGREELWRDPFISEWWAAIREGWLEEETAQVAGYVRHREDLPEGEVIHDAPEEPAQPNEHAEADESTLLQRSAAPLRRPAFKRTLHRFGPDAAAFCWLWD